MDNSRDYAELSRVATLVYTQHDISVHRRSALEESLTDKQQLLTRMADCLSWLQQAEKHLASQKPLGGDYYQIHDQYLAHQVTSSRLMNYS